MLTSEFTGLVLIANIVAWPLAYYIVRTWLQNFVYRTKISPWMFVFAAGLALGLTLLTVSIQAFKAACTDPVKILRYE